MADMSREKAISLTKRVKEVHVDRYCAKSFSDALEFAIADMKRVEELETEVEALKTDLWFHQNGYWAIDTKYKRLKHCLEEIKNTCLVSPSVIFPSDILDTINEYLGEESE